MERNVTIVLQETGKRVNLNGFYTTLKDVKDALLEQNINTNDMEFMEGISKTKMSEPDAQLPTNILYKGKQTNNLVFLVTRIGKKIASGASNRALLYASIRELNLQEDCKKAFGKNYTLVSNTDLEWLINQKMTASAPNVEEKEELNMAENREIEEDLDLELRDPSVCRTILNQGNILLEEYRRRIKDMIEEFYLIAKHMLFLTKRYDKSTSEEPSSASLSDEEVNEILGL